jgi:hypothetical protein
MSQHRVLSFEGSLSKSIQRLSLSPDGAVTVPTSS